MVDPTIAWLTAWLCLFSCRVVILRLRLNYGLGFVPVFFTYLTAQELLRYAKAYDR